MKIRSILFIALAGVFVQCSPPVALAIQPGEERCAHCRMDIADMRFNAQLITSKKKRHHFDSVECMQAWMTEHKEVKIAHAYVKNFLQNTAFIDYTSAYYLQSKRVPSPMGAGLAAYATREQASTAQREWGGRLLHSDDLVAFVQSWQKEALSR